MAIYIPETEENPIDKNKYPLPPYSEDIYPKQNKNQLAINIDHERLRRELWVKVYINSNDVTKEGNANLAVEYFDKFFSESNDNQETE